MDGYQYVRDGIDQLLLKSGFSRYTDNIPLSMLEVFPQKPDSYLEADHDRTFHQNDSAAPFDGMRPLFFRGAGRGHIDGEPRGIRHREYSQRLRHSFLRQLHHILIHLKHQLRLDKRVRFKHSRRTTI